MDFFRAFFEKQIFGVSSWWGNKLGVKASIIRLFFIYATFTNAITVILYLIMVLQKKCLKIKASILKSH